MESTSKRFPNCILSTVCIPWDEQYRFLEETFRRAVRQALSGTPHVYVFGTAGEGYAVTEPQFDQIVGAFADEMHRAGAEPMVGIIHLSLGTICERIRRCRDSGVRLFQVSLPSWGPLSEAELFRFFEAVCGGFPDCRFLHYNLPRTKRLVRASEYARLAAEHPNLVATKNSSDSFQFSQQLLQEAPALQHFLNETGYLYCRPQAECGLLASLVTSWPRVRQVFEAPLTGDLARIVQLQREILTYHRLLASLGDSVHIDGAYDKLFARVNDPEFPLRLLPPYSHASDEQFRRFEADLRRELPDWTPRKAAQ